MNMPASHRKPIAREPRAQKIVRQLFKVGLISDIHERLAEHGLALPPGARRRERLERIQRRRLLFIHVPKTGGTSISRMIYDLHIGHSSIRYYRAAIPDLVDQLPSFAVLRDPEARFLSAYRHARHGSASDSDICPAHRDHYRRFQSVDDALDHVENAASPYALDPIFRSQDWFLRDRSGRLVVHQLERLEELAAGNIRSPYLRGPLPHLNRSAPIAAELTELQRRRIRDLYFSDYKLISNIM